MEQAFVGTVLRTASAVWMPTPAVYAKAVIFYLTQTTTGRLINAFWKPPALYLYSLSLPAPCLAITIVADAKTRLKIARNVSLIPAVKSAQLISGSIQSLEIQIICVAPPARMLGILESL